VMVGFLSDAIISDLLCPPFLMFVAKAAH